MEKYGVIPKRFTKAWWGYFWDYYKIHTIVTIFVISIIGVTIYQMVTQVDYDSIITYIGDAYYNDDAPEVISDKISTIADDINLNGKIDIFFQPIINLNSGSKVENPQLTMGFEVKKLTEIQKGKGFIFIFDEEQLQIIYDNNIATDLFMPIEEWSNYDVLENTGTEAEKCFIKLPENNLLKSSGFMIDDAYIGIREIREDEADGLSNQKEAIKIAKFIIEQK